MSTSPITMIENKDIIQNFVENMSTTTAPRNIDEDMENAISIWECLGMSEKEYLEKYHSNNNSQSVLSSSSTTSSASVSVSSN